MNPGRPTTSIRRDDLALAGWGVIRQDSLWIVPNDAPDALIALVDDACERRNMDWAFIKDKLSLDEVKEAMSRRGRAE